MESGAPPTELRTVIRQGNKVIQDTTGSYKWPSNSDIRYVGEFEQRIDWVDEDNQNIK